MNTLDFDKLGGLVPAVVQDHTTLKVLMVGFMNAQAYAQTQESGKVTFFSRTKNRLWTKGETSGNFLHVKKIMIDCDNDTLLILAQPEGVVCHTGADTCFNEVNKSDSNLLFLSQLQTLVDERKRTMPENSYTTKLFNKGINKIAQKVGEEAVELVIEAKDDNKELFLNEAADLFFHSLVLFTAKGYRIEDVVDVLIERHK